MKRMQTPAGRGQKFTSWLDRHKVAVLLLALALVAAIWAGGSWARWQGEVRAERERYMTIDKHLTRLSGLINRDGSGKVHLTRECERRGDTGFGRTWLDCNVEVELTYLMASQDKAERATEEVRTILANDGFTLKAASTSSYFNEIAAYDFSDQGFDCVYDSQYYKKDDVLPAGLYDGSPTHDEVAVLSFSCGGDARTNYFPVSG